MTYLALSLDEVKDHGTGGRRTRSNGVFVHKDHEMKQATGLDRRSIELGQYSFQFLNNALMGELPETEFTRSSINKAVK